MERTLGVVLFTRSPDGLKPTAAALKLKPAAILMESAAASLQRSASAGESAAGVVKIVCGEIMALEVLPPVFVTLRALKPGLRLEVSIDNNPDHALNGDADISVQRTRPTQSDIFTRLACKIPIGLFAHPRYVAQAGAPQAIESLNAYSLIGSHAETLGLDCLGALGVDVGQMNFVVRSDSFSVQLAAIRAGVGIGAIQVPLAIQDPGLMRILPSQGSQLEMWLAMRQDRLGDRRVRIAFDLMADHLAAYARETPPAAAESGTRPAPESKAALGVSARRQYAL
jgi:DNA-binding transcriptional LysR family regulator